MNPNITIVVSQFNKGISRKLLKGALDTYKNTYVKNHEPLTCCGDGGAHDRGRLALVHADNDEDRCGSDRGQQRQAMAERIGQFLVI